MDNEKTLKNKKLLVVSEGFPSFNGNKIVGIFIKNQLDMVCGSFSDVTVVSLRKYYSLRSYLFRKVKKDRKRPKNYQYNNVKIYYPNALIVNKFLNKNYFSFTKIDGRIKAIENLLKKEKRDYDIIHAHFGLAGKMIASLRKKREKPLLVSFYGFDAYMSKYNANYYQNLFTNADLFLTLSDHMSNKLEELGCPREKIRKHHLGVNTEFFKPISVNDTGKRSNHIRILLVANFVEKKGILDAIKAFHIVYKKNPNIVFDIVGRGSLKTKIEEEILNLGLRKQISLINNYKFPNPREIILEYLQNCDIFILPSVTAKDGDSEGTPVVLMEAASCGKPCITTQHSGNPEVVLHEITGLVAPERNVGKLAQALETMVCSEELRKEYGNNARNHILKAFNSTIQTKELIEIYKKLLSNG